MKKGIVLVALLIIALAGQTQQIMKVYSNGASTSYAVTDSDTLYFSTDQTNLFLNQEGTITGWVVAEVDSICFSPAVDNNIYIHFNGSGVDVINPLESSGVTVGVTGQDVIVNSLTTLKDITYILSGTTADGFVKFYSDKRFNIVLNGVEITNPNGPAINIQSDNRIRVSTVLGTISKLEDGATYDAAVEVGGVIEDQDACFFSNGDLVFWGQGRLEITAHGTDQHALKSDDIIEVREAELAIMAAVKDGIHGKDGFYMYGGTVEVHSSSDGIDGDAGVVEVYGGNLTVFSTSADVAAVTCDSTLTIAGGILNLQVQGNASKALSSAQTMRILNGTTTITLSGGVALTASGSGNSVSYCTGLRSQSDMTIDGGTISITGTGVSNRGISCDSTLTCKDADITITLSGNGTTYTNTSGQADSHHAACISVDLACNLESGTLQLTNSGKGGKGISSDGTVMIGSAIGDGPGLTIATTGTSITISNGNTDEAKGIKANGAITFINGTTTIQSANDGVKSDISVTVQGGNLTITQSYESIEAKNITISGGVVNATATNDGLNATIGTEAEANDGSLLLITGGTIYLSASNGDPVDSNGNITMTGGLLIAHGPQSQPEVGIDVNGTFAMNGGFMIVSGTNSNMTEGPANSSSQRSVIFKTSQSQSANTIFHVEDSNGNELVSFAPVRPYASMVFSSPQLVSGGTYKVYTGGSYSNGAQNGYYQGGNYTAGTLKTTFTSSSVTQTVNF